MKTVLSGQRVPTSDPDLTKAHAHVSTPRHSPDPGETIVVRTDTLTRPWGGGVEGGGGWWRAWGVGWGVVTVVTTEPLTGPRGKNLWYGKNNTIQYNFIVCCVEKFAFWLVIIYIKHSIKLTIKHQLPNETRS